MDIEKGVKIYFVQKSSVKRRALAQGGELRSIRLFGGYKAGGGEVGGRRKPAEVQSMGGRKQRNEESNVFTEERTDLKVTHGSQH